MIEANGVVGRGPRDQLARTVADDRWASQAMTLPARDWRSWPRFLCGNQDI
jgi:hypothetical protein